MKKTQVSPASANLPFAVGAATEDLLNEGPSSYNLPEDYDLSTLGANFRAVESEPEDVVLDYPNLPPPSDTRSQEDLQQEALNTIINNFDVPEHLVAKGKESLERRIGEFTEFLVTEVVPVTLAVEPSCASLRPILSEVLGTELEDKDVKVRADSLISFAAAASYLKARLKIMEMLNLPPDVIQRVLAADFNRAANTNPQE